MVDGNVLDMLSVRSFAALDVETTGLDADKDEVIEIGIVRMAEG